MILRALPITRIHIETEGFVIPSTNCLNALASIRKMIETMDTRKYGLIRGRSSAGWPRWWILKKITVRMAIRTNESRKLATIPFLSHAETTYLLSRARFSPTRGIIANENPVPKIMNVLSTLFTNDAAASSSVLC